MGSDLSYEDMMEDPVLGDIDEAEISGEETLLERPCWILDLLAKKEKTAYARRRAWVDQERFLILRSELFARSGKLLKTLEAKSVRRFGERWVQDRMIFKDAMKNRRWNRVPHRIDRFRRGYPGYCLFQGFAPAVNGL